jgi:hypothetical protein
MTDELINFLTKCTYLSCGGAVGGAAIAAFLNFLSSYSAAITACAGLVGIMTGLASIIFQWRRDCRESKK